MMKKHRLLLCFAAVIALTACSIPAAGDIDISEYNAQHAENTEPAKEAMGTVTEAWGKKTETTPPEITTTPAPVVVTISDEELLTLDNKEIGYGQSVQFDENNRPAGAKDFTARYGEEYNAYALFDSEDEICLTFDQGYENGFTGQILDTLKEKDVHAIFFLTGDYVRRNDELIQRMIDEGHILGNHGDRHKSLAALLETSVTDAEAELLDCQALVKEKFGYEMKYMRPPEGKYSERSLALAERLGYMTLMYSFAYKDWEVNNQPEEQAAFEKITAHPHGGEFMLLHSVSKTNMNILGDVIDNLREQGFTLTLPEMSAQ